ncbi:MAG: tRNA (adenosine(37)-N6)-threonylcarbamoyltransferase complex dimerization subunit type 1 TsaB [Bacilli bacterium]|nr:tRNA (adenosine(37)-N6)-threonylcarbamoyltransferase complex dimerization subunit type 1 TsaB [Bacilli bacterium]
MICLFFDTSSDLLKVSLIKDNKIIFDKELHTKNDHSSYLVPTIDEAFKSNNIDFKELDEIIVGNGPGSFTGTRISIAVAKTYAFSFNIPVYMISSLEELIYDNDGYDFYVPIIEEKKENLYFSIFDKDKKRVMDDTYSSTEYMYKKLEELDGKILLISLSDKEYEKYDTVKASINALNIMKNIDVNNEKVNPHLLKPNYIKKIEAEAKL